MIVAAGTPSRPSTRATISPVRSFPAVQCTSAGSPSGAARVAKACRGRGSVYREKRVIQQTRYHITRIVRQEDHIADLGQRLGWKAFVTNAAQERLSLQEAVLC